MRGDVGLGIGNIADQIPPRHEGLHHGITRAILMLQLDRPSIRSTRATSLARTNCPVGER
jgi:hypothetical protein